MPTTPLQAIEVLCAEARGGSMSVDAVAATLESLAMTILASEATFTPERAAGTLWHLAEALRRTEGGLISVSFA
jgi:hypothetical protein